MDDISGPEKNSNSVDYRRKKRILTRTRLVILVVLIAAGLIIASLMWPGELDTSVQILEAGDHLHYNVTTYSDGRIFNGTADYDIYGADKSGISSVSVFSGWGDIPDSNADFKPYLARSEYYGQLIGTDHLNTSFGKKCVKEMYYFDFGEVTVLSIGMDSSIVYQWTVSSSEGDYWYSYELTESNNTRLNSVDEIVRVTSVKGLSNPTPTPGPSCTWQYHEPESGYGYMAGSVQMEDAENFHYIAGGNLTVFVFDLQDLRDIQDNGVFTYQSALSRLRGNPGETNITVAPGIYWYVAIYQGSNAPIPTLDVPASLHSTDIEVGGYFIGYFDS